MLQTGKLAKLFALDRSGIHYYTKQGIIHPVIGENGYNEFSVKDIMLLANTRFYRGLEYSLEDAQKFLSSDSYDIVLEGFNQKSKELDEKINELMRLKQINEDMINLFSFVDSYKEPYIYEEDTTYYYLEGSDDNVDAINQLFKHVPLINYTFQFKITNGELENRFGARIDKKWIESLHIELPDSCEEYHYQKQVLFIVKKDMNCIDKWEIDDLKEVIEYCKTKGYELAGEGSAYIMVRDSSTDDSYIDFICICNLK